MSREVERKYAVHEGFAVPDLSGTGPVVTVDEPRTQTLVATYYDTPDLRLAREGVTLRRRTGGDDAGWTLKLPDRAGAAAGREEVVAPLGRSKTPPPDLRDLVTARVRGASLAPVGELSTTRVARLLRDGEGTALAEVVDDTVTTTGPRSGRGVADGVAAGVGATVFREVEVELAPGADPAVLDAVDEALRAAGAVVEEFQPKLVRALGARALEPADPPPPAGRLRRKDAAGELVTSYLRTQVRALLAQDVRVRRDEEDSVHKARVATRRLRGALRTFRPLLEPDGVAGVGDELKWLAGELGQARDAEVVLVRLRALVREQPDELLLGPVAARVDERLLGDLLRGQETALAALRSPRYTDLLERLVALATAPPLTPAAAEQVRDVVPARVRSAWRALVRSLDGLETLEDEALHEARKKAKRARYAAEAAALVHGEEAEEFADRVAAVQEVLGEHQDGVVARGVLRDLGLAAHAAGENAWSYGWLAGREQARADAARSELPAVWAEARRGRYRRWLE